MRPGIVGKEKLDSIRGTILAQYNSNIVLLITDILIVINSHIHTYSKNDHLDNLNELITQGVDLNEIKPNFYIGHFCILPIVKVSLR